MISNDRRTRSQAAAFLVSFIFLSACGGGGGGGSSSAPIPAGNTAPIANAGVDAIAFKNTPVTLDGSTSTDQDRDSLTYAWTQLSGTPVALSSSTAAQPTFTAPTTSGTLVFSLIVSDGKTSSVADTVAVMVTDRVPVAAAGANKNVRIGTAVTLDGRSSNDPDGDTLAYIWTQTSGPAVTIKDNKDGTISFAAPPSAQVLGFSLRVSDGEMISNTSDVVVSVSASGNNTAPTIDAGLNQTVARNAHVTLNGFVFDPEYQPIMVQWKQLSGPAVTLSDATVPYASFTAPTSASSLVFELSASDGVLSGIPAKVTITVQNFAPSVAVALSPSAPKVTNSLSAVANVTDPDGDTVTTTYAWTRNGATIAGQSGSTLPAHSFVKGDTVAVRVTSSDGTLSTTQTASTVIQDSLPVFTATPPTSVNYGAVFSFQITATDDDGESVQFVIHHGPAGMQVDSSGNVTWTANLPMFDRTLDVNWGVGIAGNPAAILSGTVTVNDSLRQYPLRRGASETPATHHSFIVTDLDGDGHDEILAGSRKILYEMGRVGSTYEQRWVFPFSLGANDITAIAAADVDGDHKKEIFVATSDHLYKLDGATRRIVAEFNPGANLSCKDLVATDLTNDGVIDLVCLTASTVNYNKSRVVVFNAQTGSITWQSPDFDNVTDIAVGNVDADAAKEIILSNGYVYDGNTFVNEWAASAAFGSYVTTGDVDGDGIDEVIAFNGDHFTAWDVVNRSAKWQVTMSPYYYYNVRGLVAVDLDGDGTAEIVTVGDTYNSIGAYHRNTSTGATELVFAVPNIASDAIVQYAVGDVNNDGTREIVIAIGSTYSGAGFKGVSIQSPQGVVWQKDLTTESYGPFVGGQLARTAPGSTRLIFGSNQSGYYSGPRLLSLDPLTGIYAQTSLLTSNSGTLAVDIADFDGDGIDEAFVSLPYGTSNYIAYDVAGDTLEWSTSGSNTYYASPITHADLNGDGFADLIAITNDGYVLAYDAHNQTLIWKSDPLTGSGIDIAVADVDGDGVLEIVALTNSKLFVFEQATGPNKFRERVSTSVGTQYTTTPHDLLVTDVDGDGKPEIFVLTQTYSNTADIYRYTGSLAQQGTFSVPGYPQTMFAEDLSGRRNIVISTAGDPYNKIYPVLYAVDGRNGTKVWQSPALPAQVQLNSLQYVDANADGVKEITFGTAAGMYSTR